MAIDPEDLNPRKKPETIALDQDISRLSEFELNARIAALEAEIVRCREAIAARRSTRSSADALFRR
jgi:uncharacterized small protein (DUF1192 family)